MISYKNGMLVDIGIVDELDYINKRFSRHFPSNSGNEKDGVLKSIQIHDFKTLMDPADYKD